MFVSFIFGRFVNRYLMYEVNLGEGFNLRRDVYIRMANMVRYCTYDIPSKFSRVVKPNWNITPPFGETDILDYEYCCLFRETKQGGFGLIHEILSTKNFPVIGFEHALERILSMQCKVTLKSSDFRGSSFNCIGFRSMGGHYFLRGGFSVQG